ncbi:saccharopine dehydrogenase NADP-binding domain-containing protein [bacterium]|nr:saccharopine dehydrogenase NADP-binding domain-containing protein [bacterium]
MQKILILGAGKSSPYLIHYLLEQAEQNDWVITVGDIDLNAARKGVSDHPRGLAVHFDINDRKQLRTLVQAADVVIHMLAPAFQGLIAEECVRLNSHMISASYCNRQVRELSATAEAKGLLLLTEIGLDPGIDHMGAVDLMEKIRGQGGRIKAFRSYGSGIPAPDSRSNPLNYAITWNPWNVAMAGTGGAMYLERGKIKIVPVRRVFSYTWPVEVEGVGTLEAYPNRDSLSYIDLFQLDGVETMIRGTLRYPGWAETWQQIITLGLPTQAMEIPDLQTRTYREVVEMFLPLNPEVGASTVQRLARLLSISPTGRIMDNLVWLGLLSEERITAQGNSPADMLSDLLQKKLPLLPEQRDMVILLHELDVEYDDRREQITSTMVKYGQPGGFTAMAETVGLPAAIATRLLLQGKLNVRGCCIPIDPTIYRPILQELADEGITFVEKTEPLT